MTHFIFLDQVAQRDQILAYVNVNSYCIVKSYSNFFSKSINNTKQPQAPSLELY